MDWIWIIIGWIFLNVIVKLFVNSIERIYKNKIDNLVSTIPSVLNTFWQESIRYSILLFLLPTLIPYLLFPKLFNLKVLAHIGDSIRFTLSRKRFKRMIPFLFYTVRHPAVLFSKKAQLKADEWWRKKVFSDPKIGQQYLD